MNLERISLSGATHESLIEEFVRDLVVKRGKLTSLSFVADYWGITKSAPSREAGD